MNYTRKIWACHIFFFKNNFFLVHLKYLGLCFHTIRKKNFKKIIIINTHNSSLLIYTFIYIMQIYIKKSWAKFFFYYAVYLCDFFQAKIKKLPTMCKKTNKHFLNSSRFFLDCYFTRGRKRKFLSKKIKMTVNGTTNIKNLKCALSLPCVPDICQSINTTLDLKY